MKRLISYIESYWKTIACVLLCVSAIHGIIGLYKGYNAWELLICFAAEPVLFFLAWGMMFAVLGFQHINPFCPKPVFTFFCYFMIAASCLGILYRIVQETVLSVTQPVDVYIPVAFSPAYFGWVMSAIYLYKKYAVESDEYTEKEKTYLEKPEQKKKKRIISVILFSIALIFAVGLWQSISNTFVQSEPYRHSIALIEHNPQVQEYLGTQYKRIGFISGSLQSNSKGTGHASFTYKLKGKNGVSRVHVVAEKENDVWQYKKILFYKMKGSLDVIDLLEMKPTVNKP